MLRRFPSVFVFSTQVVYTIAPLQAGVAAAESKDVRVGSASVRYAGERSGPDRQAGRRACIAGAA